MKSSLALVLIVLQLLTAGLVVALMVRRNETDPALVAQITELTSKFQGAVHQERQLINSLEALRQDAATRSRPGAVGDPNHPTALDAAPTQADPAPASPKVSFPEAAAALAKLKQLEHQLRDEIKKSGQMVSPIRAEIEKAKGELINRGNEAVYVVGTEIDLQPYEKSRDAQFAAYLLDEVVPAFGALAKADAMKIARSALVRSTNEAPVKFAAAKAMQRIDDQGWVKDVVDVIVLGTADEVDLRARLLGVFADSPRPEAVDLCKRFMEEAQYPSQLRTKAIMVIEKQNSDAVNRALRGVVFDDPAPLMKNQALDALCRRLTDAAERRKLLEDVLAIDTSRLPASVREKAENLLKGMKEGPLQKQGR